MTPAPDITKLSARQIEGIVARTVVIIDTREQAPWKINAFPTEVATLKEGDYAIRGERNGLVVERKSLDDLCGTLGKGRARFDDEIYERMRLYKCKALLIEASREEIEAENYRSQMKPAAIFSALDAYEVRANLHIRFCGNAYDAARQFEGLVRQHMRGKLKDFNRLMESLSDEEEKDNA